MPKLVDMLSPLLVLVLVLWMVGCSHGLQEVGFAIPDSKDGVHHIVTRDVASSRWSVNQPHPAGLFHCTAKRSSEEMAELRRDGNEHTWYIGCTPASQHSQHQYVMTSDQSNASLVQGPVSAAMISAGVAFAGHQIGRGIRSQQPDATTNNNSTSSEGGQGGAGGSAMNNSGNRTTTTNVNPSRTMNINSNNTFRGR